MKKTNYSKFEKDLSSVQNSLANVLEPLMSSMAFVKNNEDLKLIVHDAVDAVTGHGVSEATAKRFFVAIDRCHTKEKTMECITSFYLAGSGMGLGFGC